MRTPNKAKASYYGDTIDNSGKPPTNYGTLTTRVLIVEKEPLVSNEDGMTVGQLIDQHLERVRNPFEGSSIPDGWVAPVIHSITLDLPTED